MPSEVNWPAVQYETLSWVTQSRPGVVSRSELRRHQGPYQAAVPAVIAAETLLLPSDVISVAEEAALEIARFDAEMGTEIAPFSALLLRSESAASSRIENLTASARAIAEAELTPNRHPNADRIVANTRAMQAAAWLANDLGADSILAMHRVLMERSEPSIGGRWRSEQVWIGGTHVGPHRAMFVPPQHSRVESAIADLVRFCRRDDLPVLPQAAIAHAQFETIHPFPDGNGRTGRALLHSMLRNKGLTRNTTIPISAGLLVDTNAYFAALGSYREGDAAEMVRQLSSAAFLATDNGRQLVVELRGIRAGWNERIRVRRDSTAWRIAELVMSQPVINAALLVERLHIPAKNANRYLEPLELAGVLTEFTDKKRDRAWRSIEVIAALDAFAARAGRRGRAD